MLDYEQNTKREDFKAKFLGIMLISLILCANILYTDKNLINLSQSNTENLGDGFLDNDSTFPQTSATALTLNNGNYELKIDEKGFLSNAESNLYFEGFHHNFYSMFWVAAYDKNPKPLSDAIVVAEEPLRLLSDAENPNGAQIGSTVVELSFPSVTVNIRIVYAVYPDENFFVMSFTFHVDDWAYNIEFWSLSDLDIDETIDNDNAYFDPVDNLIWQEDAISKRAIGWNSPVTPVEYEVGDPTDLETHISGSLGNVDSALNQNCGMVTKYYESDLYPEDYFTVPIIYGFGDNATDLRTKTSDIKNQFINDFAIYNLDVDLSGSQNVSTSVLNSGTSSDSRIVDLYVNDIWHDSQSTPVLGQGTFTLVSFTDLGLDLASENKIEITIDDDITDYNRNDVVLLDVIYISVLKVNIIDSELKDVPDVNITLVNSTNHQKYASKLTDSNGNCSFGNLPDGDYTAILRAPWLENRFIRNYSISYPSDGDFIVISTNLTEFNIQVKDITGNVLPNSNISIFDATGQDQIYNSLTDSYGNISIYYIQQNYDINITYNNYGNTTNLAYLDDFVLLATTYHIETVDMFKIHLNIKNPSEDPVDGAIVELYNWTSPSVNGDYIGFELSDENGNVTINWLSSINYSIRIIFFSEETVINDLFSAFNFTAAPYSSYLYENLTISLAGEQVENFETELTLFNSLPLTYDWGDNIDLSFMYNITYGPGGSSGPTWANETLITVEDIERNIIFQGEADKIPGELGNHSFVINTTSGYFDSGNPIVYSISIEAVLYGYGDPEAINEIFNIYNISTTLNISKNVDSLIYNENFTVYATYRDLNNDSPIHYGELWIEWGDFTSYLPMTYLSDGLYAIEINSTIASPGYHSVSVLAQKDHYNERTRNFNIEIYSVPTRVNGSDLFYSEHELIVTQKDVTVEYEFWDNYQHVPISNIAPSFYLSHEESDLIVTGVLEHQSDGIYRYDPITSELPIGNYTSIITFEKIYYTTSTAIAKFEIYAIPTSLNDSTIFRNTIDIYRFDEFSLNLNLVNNFEENIENANTTYTIQSVDANYSDFGLLNNLGMGNYQFKPGTEILPIGSYSISIVFEKVNHSTSLTTFTLDIHLIPISTDIIFMNENQEYYNSSDIDIEQKNDLILNITTRNHKHEQISGGTFTYRIIKDNVEIESETIELEDGNFQLMLSSFDEIGLYVIEINIVKEEYIHTTEKIYVQVNYQEFLDIPIPFWIIIGVAFLITITGLSSYIVIKNARIPKFVKDLNHLKLVITRGRKYKLDNLRIDEIISQEYGSRWISIDLESPFKPVREDIKQFIDLYQQATNKALLVEEAKLMFEDLSIYSRDEINIKLKNMGISEQYLPRIVDLVLEYINQLSQDYKTGGDL